MEAMRKLLLSFGLIALVAGCTGLSESFTYEHDLARAESLSAPAGSFNEYLRQEYLNGFDMAKDSAAEYHWASAGLFVNKAIAAGEGSTSVARGSGQLDDRRRR